MSCEVRQGRNVVLPWSDVKLTAHPLAKDGYGPYCPGFKTIPYGDAQALRDAIRGEIQKKDGDLVGQMISEGTTPRRLTDLIGSLCDLTSGSGDKGTPIVLVQGYFDNYTK